METDSALDGSDLPVIPPGEDELPSDDGEPMETNDHRLQMVLLIQELKQAWAGREDYFVAGNMFVYFSEEQVTYNDFRGPDFFLVLGTTGRSRKSWVAWRENGKLPDLVIELLSNRTRHVDRGEKMHIYSKVWRTPEYFLFDPVRFEFEGYRLDPANFEYRRIEPNASGDLFSQVTGFGLGLREGLFEDVRRRWLWFLDPNGHPLPTPQDVADIERRRADDEKQRADDEKQRADDEKRRADDEKRRADDEERRADELSERVRELEEKLRGG
ncbi:MAG TPA: Uma2 family endonuclease [Polyangiaceae bacterium]|nr:Uma2 family endonuclease [Polyangiaceae bacterium]